MFFILKKYVKKGGGIGIVRPNIPVYTKRQKDLNAERKHETTVFSSLATFSKLSDNTALDLDLVEKKNKQF